LRGGERENQEKASLAKKDRNDQIDVESEMHLLNLEASAH